MMRHSTSSLMHWSITCVPCTSTRVAAHSLRILGMILLLLGTWSLLLACLLLSCLMERHPLLLLSKTVAARRWNALMGLHH